MTRINTNVSSLVAQKTLARSNVQLQDALTRLSTGLRINSGKDDPAGLIASEALGSDITSANKAISNSQRASQMIATADSALGQVSSLLNDIRGLVTEAANKGAMSDDQIAANQLQVDSSLEALNRIAQTTSFQGRRLLDGSLDFVTQSVSGMTSVTDLNVNQATLGTTGSLAVNVDITAAASQAQITDTGFTAGVKASATLTFAAGATITGSDDGSGGVAASNGTLDIISTSLTAGSGTQIVFVADGDLAANTATATYSGSTLTINISNKAAAGDTGATSTTIAAAINSSVTASPYFQAKRTDTAGAGFFVGGQATKTTDTSTLTVAAHTTKGADYNHMAINILQGAVGATTPDVAYDVTTNVMNITIDNTGVTTLASIRTAINNYTYDGVQLFDGGGADGTRVNVYAAAGADIKAAGNTGTSGGNTLNDDVTVQLTGSDGSQVFSFEQGTSIDQVVSAINAQTDGTGVLASMTVNGTSGDATLNLLSLAYGSNGFVDVNVITEGNLSTFKSTLSDTRLEGTNIQATVNGITAKGAGNTLSINTANLALSATVSEGSSTDFSFNIVGGGAVFQLGPDVVSNQQARMGIQSVNTGKLGGASGRLLDLGSGGSASLTTDPTNAAKIVKDVLGKVALMRGRLGAFQKTMVDTNIKTLTDTVENLTAAQSSIKDADFAAESANMTRAQVLVQAGTSVLAVANQSPQNVLALLR